jgi:DNA-binding Xre family transcriptional regulator
LQVCRSSGLFRPCPCPTCCNASDDPPQRIGQFLLSRKKITEEQLRQALTIKEETSQFLGQTLVEMGALTSDELCEELTAKVEEIIYSLFDWGDAVFRFEETVDERIDAFPVELRIDDILLRGLQRVDEMEHIRGVLRNPGIVLRYTSKPPGPEIFGDETSRSMYSSIDGERTLADILLHVHGTEYQVKRFLFELHEKGYVEIASIKNVAPKTSAPARPQAERREEPDLDLSPLERPDPGPPTMDLEPVTDPTAAATPREAPVATSAGVGPTTSAALATSPVAPADDAQGQPGRLRAELARARELLAGGDLEGALDVLDVLYQENPGDDALRRLTAETEAAFVEKCYRHYLPNERVPILTRPIESLSSESLTPQEFFVLSRIDGSWDVKSFIQVAPFREVEALRTLKRMCEMGMVELCDPA